MGRIAKTILFVMAAGTVSLTSLTLPAARALTAALPASAGQPLSPSFLQTIAGRGHAELGDLAAEIACTYLKRFSGAEESKTSAGAQLEHGGIPKTISTKSQPAL